MSEQTEEQNAEAEAEAKENDTSGFVVESGGPQPAAEAAQGAEAEGGEKEGDEGEKAASKPAAAAQEGEEGEGGDGEGEGEEQREGLPPGVIKRLQRLRRREQKERARADALEAQLREKGEEPPDREEPQAQDFDEYEDYQKALDEWQKSKKAEGKKKEPDPEAAGKAEAARHTATLHEALAGEAPDLWERLTGDEHGDDYAISPEMLAAWAESDDPVAIGRYLAEHPDETYEIAGMTPRQIERKFLKIELGVGSQPAKAAEPEKKAEEKAEEKPKKRQSRAPDPIETGGQRRAAEMTAEEAAEKGDFATFEKLRAKDEEASVGGW